MKKQTSNNPSPTFRDQLVEAGYIRQSQLIPRYLPFSPATLWRKVKNGSFPKPVKLSERITAWRTDDVLEWLEARR